MSADRPACPKHGPMVQRRRHEWRHFDAVDTRAVTTWTWWECVGLDGEGCNWAPQSSEEFFRYLVDRTPAVTTGPLFWQFSR